MLFSFLIMISNDLHVMLDHGGKFIACPDFSSFHDNKIPLIGSTISFNLFLFLSFFEHNDSWLSLLFDSVATPLVSMLFPMYFHVN